MPTLRLLAPLGAALLAAAPPAADDPRGIEAFSRHDRFVDAKISPKGTYLAAVSTEGGKRTLVFFDLASRKVASVLRPDQEHMVGEFHWASDERAIVQLAEVEGTLAAPVTYGQLYAVDAKGTNGRLVYGYNAGQQQVGSRIRKAAPSFASGFFIDRVRGDDRQVLIGSLSWYEVGDQFVRVLKLDVQTGLTAPVTQLPIPNGWVITDEKGEPRLGGARDEHGVRRRFLRDPEGTWRDLESARGFTPSSRPVGIVASERIVYTLDPAPKGFGLYSVSLDTGARKLLAENPMVPPRSFVFDEGTGRLLAAEYEPDLPTYELTATDHPLVRALDGLLAARPNGHVHLLNTTDDGKKAVVYVYSDRDPGEFMLLDVARFSVEPIVQARPWVKPESMAEMAAFHIKASDGVQIHGYLTRPPGVKAGAPSPMVVLVHGGPHGPRDHWAYDNEVQLLASRGFAVLQVNFRGSGGYGDGYEAAGYRQWGDRILKDIIDGTRWAIGKGVADPARVCIFGGSFGGYAAMQASVVAPDLYRCAVGYAGVYDLSIMATSGDTSWSRTGRGYLRLVLGEDEQALKAASPVHNAGALKAKVLLIHGEEDLRAPIKHAKLLRDALTAQGRPPEWLVEPKEAHGFYDEAARLRMYEKLVAFLEENTRPPAAPGAVVAPPAPAPKP